MRKRFTRTTRLMPRSAMRLALYSTLGGCALVWSGLAMALGLGEISLHSSLNQPLNADIALSDSAGLEESDISVGLAGADVFAQAGIERSFFLTDLHFTPLFRNGRKVIHVSSNKVVVEPYLNFIVQVTQPSGQVLRTYTLLIDPPGSVALAPPLVPTNARPEPVSSVAPMPAPVTPPPAPPAAATRKQSAQASAPARQAPDSEALTVTAAQNQQLEQSLDNLQAHVETLEQEGAEKDRQLAELQSRLVEAQAIAAARAAALPAAPAGGQGTGNTAPAEAATATAAVPEPASPAQPAPGTGQATPATTAIVTPAPAAPAPAVAPDVPLAVAPETSDLTWLLQLGALLALVLLIAAWILQRRRQRTVATAQSPSPAVTVAPAATEVDTTDLPPLPDSPTVGRREQAPSTDALDAASIYIAYGRFNEALAVLREGLQREPARRDLRLRILEVLGLQGNAHAYAEEEAALRANGEQDAVLDQTRARFPRLAPASVALAAGGVAAGGMLAAGASALSSSEHVAGATPAFMADPLVEHASSSAEAISDLDIDFDALGDLGALDELAPPRPSDGGTPDEFQLNLDDLSLDADWSSMDPFERPAAPVGRAAVPEQLPVEEPPASPEMFFSNLRELPEVMELPEEEFLSDFADEPLAPPGLGEDDLDAAFLDSFAEEPALLPGIDAPEHHLVALGDDLASGDFELPGEPLPGLDELSIDFDSIELQAQAADRLDQARSLVAQGDPQGASWLLHDLLQDSDEATREAARQMLAGL